MNSKNYIAAILTAGQLEEITNRLDDIKEAEDSPTHYADYLVDEIFGILAEGQITTTPPVSIFVHTAGEIINATGRHKTIAHESIGD